MAATTVAAPALNAPPARRDLADPWLAHRLDLSRDPLPPVERAEALGVLDVTRWLGAARKTYLVEKARWVSQQPDVRHTLVIPGSFDAVAVGVGTRTVLSHQHCWCLAEPGACPGAGAARPAGARRLDACH